MGQSRLLGFHRLLSKSALSLEGYLRHISHLSDGKQVEEVAENTNQETPLDTLDPLTLGDSERVTDWNGDHIPTHEGADSRLAL